MSSVGASFSLFILGLSGHNALRMAFKLLLQDISARCVFIDEPLSFEDAVNPLRISDSDDRYNK
jgi:hypothetical protein